MIIMLLSLIAGLLFVIARLLDSEYGVHGALDADIEGAIKMGISSLFLAGVIYGVAYGLNVLAGMQGISL